MRRQALIICGLVATALLLASPGQAAVVTQLTITGGSVAFNLSNGAPVFNQTFLQAGTLLMGQYQASGSPTPVFPTFIIGPPDHSFTIFTNPGSGATPLAAPSGITNGATIQVDLSALFASIIGPTITGGLNIGNQLPAMITGTFNEGTGAFHLAWDHVYTLPDDFVGVGSFGLDGSAQTSPVPLPGAAWLFATGSLGWWALIRKLAGRTPGA